MSHTKIFSKHLTKKNAKLDIESFKDEKIQIPNKPFSRMNTNFDGYLLSLCSVLRYIFFSR